MLRNFVNLNTLLTTFWYRECRLLGSYDRALDRLAGGAAAPAELPPACEGVADPTATEES